VIRVLHLSDVHVDVPLSSMPWRQMWNKRLIGGANLVLRRRAHFVDAREKLAQLARFAREQAVDLVICTGDYTALGTEPELAAAREAIDELTRFPLGFVTVPGNHDIYLPHVVADGSFERHFGSLLSTDMPEACVDGPWPIVRFIGDDIAVLAVNSARPNPQVWRSSGRIPDAQIEALARLCDDPKLQRRFVFVATHYAPRRADGSPDKPLHGLENADALLVACAKLPRAALLHGHIHWRFSLQLPDQPMRVFGSGSTTCSGREGFWVFELEAGRIRALPGTYRDGAYVLEPGSAVAY
jgi:3',5'-cyclic AMP phosphodiesterase CpdA